MGLIKGPRVLLLRLLSANTATNALDVQAWIYNMLINTVFEETNVSE